MHTIQLLIIDLDTYNEIQGEEGQLKAGEVLYYSKNGKTYTSLIFDGKENRTYEVIR